MARSAFFEAMRTGLTGPHVVGHAIARLKAAQASRFGLVIGVASTDDDDLRLDVGADLVVSDLRELDEVRIS